MAQQRIIHFASDTVIIREGETGTNMYRIVKGHAEVYVGYGTSQETIIGIIGPRACFGELDLLLGQPSVYTVVAFSDLYALQITEETLEDFVQTNRHTIIEIMQNMAHTMMSMRAQIDLLLKEIAAGNRPDNQRLLLAKKAMQSYGVFRTDLPAFPRKSIAEMLDNGSSAAATGQKHLNQGI